MCEDSGINTRSRRKRNRIELPMVKRKVCLHILGGYWCMANHYLIDCNLRSGITILKDHYLKYNIKVYYF